MSIIETGDVMFGLLIDEDLSLFIPIQWRQWCYELRNVPKVLCTNEDFVHVCTDLEKVKLLWIKTCPNTLCTYKDYIHMHNGVTGGSDVMN